MTSNNKFFENLKYKLKKKKTIICIIGPDIGIRVIEKFSKKKF